MDLATIIGVLGGFGVLYGAILLEGSKLSQFMNLLATVVVIGGAMTAVLVRYTLKSFMAALVTGVKQSIKYHEVSAVELIETLAELATVVRTKGPLGVETFETEDDFLKRGAQMIADGYTAEAIRTSLERERDLNHERLTTASKIYKALGEAAPGMGMVGTLIGLVSLFSHMDDPKKIGPAMAIALLTTLYGAVVSNVVALPIGDKLSNRAEEEGHHQTMIIDALLMIREGRNAQFIKDELASYLPLHDRQRLNEAA